VNDEPREPKQERREQRLKMQRARMPQHGRSLVRIYKDAILKRLKRRKVDKWRKGE